jgi:hypothetical protein
MDLSKKVTGLKPELYWKLFAILLFISAATFLLGHLEIIDPLYTAAISVLTLISAFVCLIFRYNLIFEWVIDITLIFLAIGHFTTLFTRDIAELYLEIPIVSLLFFWVLAGWWIIIYPYLALRIYRRFKKHQY